jgi:hypothetical protein
MLPALLGDGKEPRACQPERIWRMKGGMLARLAAIVFHLRTADD